MNGNCYFAEGINPTVTCNKNEGNKIAIPVLTPDRIHKSQNGRRFKEEEDDMFTLTSIDRHGVALKIRVANKQGYDIARGGKTASTSHIPQAIPEEEESESG